MIVGMRKRSKKVKLDELKESFGQHLNIVEHLFLFIIKIFSCDDIFNEIC